MQNLRGIKKLYLKAFCLSILLLQNPSEIFADKKTRKNPTAHEKAVGKFTQIQKKYREGDFNDLQYWAALSEYATQVGNLTKDQRAIYLQVEAQMLVKAEYPITAAILAVQALKSTENPQAKNAARSWQILSETSKNQPIHNLVEILASELQMGNDPAPAFGKDWFYFRGNMRARSGKFEDAIADYKKLTPTDRYFLPAKYQTAMMLVDKDKLNDARVALKTVLNEDIHSAATLDSASIIEISNQANLALARVSYEQKKFQDSVRYFRSITRSSKYFYDSLFEQSWAFFMAGYPNHALGMLHDVESPFFKTRFNPEAKMLASIIHYWMCRYEDSRYELAEFIEKYQKDVNSLGEFLDRSNLDEVRAYTLFEDYISGVSDSSLGLSRVLLETAANKENMMLVRNQYAAVLGEKQRLSRSGIFGSKLNTEVPVDYLERWIAALRQDVGRKYLAELKSMKSDFERLKEQGKFLYVELLMSEKNQLMGKELHASTKIDHVAQKENIKGWANKAQSWGESEKIDEFWKDEIGYHIFRLAPQCKLSH